MKPQINSPQAPASRLLYSRMDASLQLSISIRSLDTLIAEREIAARRIKRRVLVAHTELQRFIRSDHP